MINKIKSTRDYLSVVWGISIVYRIFGKVTGLYEVPKWLGSIIFVLIITVILLSAAIYFIERKNKKP
ncbi:MAG: hypothetical protein ACJ0P3_02425 [Flavobacteriaceae bacterium]